MMFMMSRILLVALGGALGSVARYGLSGLLQRPGGFPYGTLAANVLGCLAIGVLLGAMESRGAPLEENARAFLIPGVLGGFTTFSAFGGETMGLWQSGAAGLAVINAAANLVLGLGAFWAGLKLA